jgi:hypothetical protein
MHDEPSDALDFADMERQIQALLGGGAGGATGGTTAPASPGVDDAADPTPAAPTPDVRLAALEAEPIDPLLREIDAALADDADALLRNADGDIEGVLRSVFDERALSGQEEEINRALIEAFGTSRVERPSFAVGGTTPAVITNPVSPFEGAARALSPEILREERDRVAPAEEHGAAAHASVAPRDEPALLAPHASAAEPPVTTAPSAAVPNAAPAATVRAEATPVEPMPQQTASTTRANNAEHAPAAKETAMETAKPTSNATSPTTSTPARFLHTIAAIPLRLASAPARMMPASARTVVGLVAVTLVLWTPVAWWLAQRAAQTPAVAPITIKPAVIAKAAAEAAEPSGH